MMQTMTVADRNRLYLTLPELETGLTHIKQSPQNNGMLESIVIRPQKNERLVLEECELSPQLGVHGDDWVHRGRPHLEAQVTVMNSRVIALLARTKDRWALAGDQCVNSEAGWHLHLRGINARVAQAGKVKVGDSVVKSS